MRRALVHAASLLAATAVLVAGCSPDAELATGGCTSLVQCPIGQVCDQATRTCIDEPPDRIVGTFRCLLDGTDDDPLDACEVVANAGRTRLPFALAVCSTDPEDPDFLRVSLTQVGETRIEDGYVFNAFLSLKEARTGRSTLKVAYGAYETGTGVLQHMDLSILVATGLGGVVAFTGPVETNKPLTGYLDVPLVPAVRGASVRYGEPCPRGISDCGVGTDTRTELCEQVTDVNPVRICTGVCATDDDCRRRPGSVCILEACTTSCGGDADCKAPARCVDVDGVRGCF
jgi:hypothetical protein